MQDPQFLQMIAALRAQPQLLPAVLQEIQNSNPQLMQTIVQNQEAFMQMLGAGGQGGGMGGGAPGGGEGGPGGGQQIQVTPQEQEAIERLKGIFPNKSPVEILQVLRAAEGNEEQAAAMLFDDFD